MLADWEKRTAYDKIAVTETISFPIKLTLEELYEGKRTKFKYSVMRMGVEEEHEIRVRIEAGTPSGH